MKMMNDSCIGLPRYETVAEMDDKLQFEDAAEETWHN